MVHSLWFFVYLRQAPAHRLGFGVVRSPWFVVDLAPAGPEPCTPPGPPRNLRKSLKVFRAGFAAVFKSSQAYFKSRGLACDMKILESP